MMDPGEEIIEILPDMNPKFNSDSIQIKISLMNLNDEIIIF